MEPTNESHLPGADRLSLRIVKGFERIVALVLTVLLMIVVALATLELVRLILRDIVRARETLLDVEQMFELFGSFLLVLVGMELLTTLKAYVRHGVVQMEVVLEVALVALAQKVIVLNPKSGPQTQFGLAALILALAGANWAVRAARRRAPQRPRPPVV